MVLKNFLFSLLVFSCGLPLSAQQVVQAEDMRYGNGYKHYHVNDEQVELVVSVEEGRRFPRLTPLQFRVHWQGADRTLFNPDLVEVAQVSRKGAGKPCGVYRMREWLKKRQRQILWLGPSNVQTDEMETTVKQKDAAGRVVSSTTATTKTSVYTGENDRFRHEAEAEIRATYLQKTTLLPGDVVEGWLVGRNPRANRLRVTVPLGGKRYIFDLDSE